MIRIGFSLGGHIYLLIMNFPSLGGLSEVSLTLGYISILHCCLHPRNVIVSSASLCLGLFVHSGGSSGTKTTPVQHPHYVQNTFGTVHIWQKGST